MSLVVDKIGSEKNHFKTVQAAVNAVPDNNKSPVTIKILKGKYFEQVFVKKDYITFSGQGSNPSEVIIDYNAFVNKSGGPGGKDYTTFTSGTVQIDGDNCTLVNLTISNSAGPNCGGSSGQNMAVALRISGDKCAAYACYFTGYQDTLYCHNGTQYFRSCNILGSVDYVFGGPNIKAYFHYCNLVALGRGWFTAMQRDLEKQPNDDGAFVINACVLNATSGMGEKVYLGRPWRQDARVIVANSYIGPCVPPAGWTVWDSNTDPKRPVFWESHNVGSGAIKADGTPKRTIGKNVSLEQVDPFVDLKKFFGGSFPPANPPAMPKLKEGKALAGVPDY